MFFYGEIEKIIPELSCNSLFNKSSELLFRFFRMLFFYNGMSSKYLG